MFNKIFLMIMFLFLFLIQNTLAYEASCVNGKIKWFKMGKEKYEKRSYCLFSYQDQSFFISKSCYQEPCLAKQEIKKPIFVKDYYSEYGTPVFKLCKALLGTPHIMSYQWKGEWIASNRCVFKDSSYVQGAYLLIRWKEYIIKK